MTYAAAIWHTPGGLKEDRKAHAKQFGVIQNGCLRRVLEAYKATNVRALEAEAEIPSMQLILDEAILRSQTLRGTHPVTKKGNSHIRRKLRGR